MEPLRKWCQDLSFRDCQKDLVQFFLMEGDLVCCNDIDGLMSAYGITHDPDEWGLFTDLSKTSLKTVLLHNGNVLLSIPVGHAVHMKETYDNMIQLLRRIKYEQHQWQRIPLCHESLATTKVIGARKKNVQHSPLADSQKVLLPPLHINLGLMKNFVKVQNKSRFKVPLWKVSKV